MKYKKLFIVGCPRSGTSWTHSIFRKHPSVITAPGESRAYLAIVKPFLKEGFIGDNGWKYVLDRYNEAVADSSKDRWKSDIWVDAARKLANWVSREELCKFINKAKINKKLSDIERSELVINYIFDDFFIMSGGTASHLFVEKSPVHLIYADMILKRYPEARMIEVIRDGRDICVSLEIRAKTLSFMPKKRKEQIMLWRDRVERGIKLRSNKLFADRILQVRYEKLKQNPTREISRMFKFAEIDNSPELVAKIAKFTDFKHLRDTGIGKHYRKGIVGDWKNHFTAKDIKLFKKIANDILIELGYKW